MVSPSLTEIAESYQRTLPVEALPKPGPRRVRIQSVDLLRGLVMIIMAIDHVRVYSGILPGGPTLGIFFTRWITHFCAPAFAFFAGTSAFLYFIRSGKKNDVAWFLFTRGLLLVVLEMTVVRFLWTFNFDYGHFTHTNVIWTLGWCMVILATLVHLQPVTIGVAGLAIIFLQQVFQFIPYVFPAPLQESVANLWSFFYPSSLASIPTTGILPDFALPKVFGVSILYVIIPWIGVMMAGYGFGQLLLCKYEKLRTICFQIGIAAIGLFIAVGTVIVMVNPQGDSPFILQLLAQKKYPPSQLFLLMTLGPMIALIPWAEGVRGWLADAVRTIGRVPMFYYLLHLLLIHLSAFAVNLALYGSTYHEWYSTAPLVAIPESERWGLALLYFVWLIDIVILYFICRRYARYKSSHPEKAWIKYL